MTEPDATLNEIRDLLREIRDELKVMNRPKPLTDEEQHLKNIRERGGDYWKEDRYVGLYDQR